MEFVGELKRKYLSQGKNAPTEAPGVLSEHVAGRPGYAVASARRSAANVYASVVDEGHLLSRGGARAAAAALAAAAAPAIASSGSRAVVGCSNS